MASRKLRVVNVEVQNVASDKGEYTTIAIVFSRKLTALEVSGIKAVLDGEIR